jgi:predicted RNA-binding protein
MCESKVFVAAPEGERLVLADVTSITAEGDGYQLANLFGEQVHVRGRLVVADLLNHRVVFELLP